MKFVLAQLLADGITDGFDHIKAGWGGVDVWLLGIGFGFLLFFDFGGYSHMVIGAARIFGIRVPENFNYPFFSTTPSIFWTRWHMSLSFWIRDYLFNPLAAAGRRYSWWPYGVLVISMTFFGVWHGPRWTYVVYGLYHGFVLVMHRIGQQMKRRLSIHPPRYVGAFLSWGITFMLVSIGFIFFRGDHLAQAWAMLGALFTPGAYRRFAMPRAFYLLTSAIVVGYFVFVAGHSFLLYLRARYRETVRDSQHVAGAKKPVIAASNFPLLIGASFDALGARLWWWLAPALSVLAFWIILVIHTKKTAIAVSLFIYALF
jgi:alginate O-acetyltransferase complex protein AlgI